MAEDFAIVDDFWTNQHAAYYLNAWLVDRKLGNSGKRVLVAALNSHSNRPSEEMKFFGWKRRIRNPSSSNSWSGWKASSPIVTAPVSLEFETWRRILPFIQKVPITIATWINSAAMGTGNLHSFYTSTLIGNPLMEAVCGCICLKGARRLPWISRHKQEGLYVLRAMRFRTKCFLRTLCGTALRDGG